MVIYANAIVSFSLRMREGEKETERRERERESIKDSTTFYVKCVSVPHGEMDFYFY